MFCEAEGPALRSHRLIVGQQRYCANIADELIFIFVVETLAGWLALPRAPVRPTVIDPQACPVMPLRLRPGHFWNRV
jgi:hypothetical protein